MQVNATFGSHTLSLFGVKQKAAVAGGAAQNRLAPSPAVPRSADVSWLYGPPPLRAGRLAPDSPLSEQVIAKLKAFRDIELKGLKETINTKISSELRRTLGSDEDVWTISVDEKMSLSSDLRSAAWDQRITEIFIGIATAQQKEIGVLNVNNMFAGKYSMDGDVTAWETETAKGHVQSVVNGMISAMEALKSRLLDPSFAAVIDSKAEHDAFKAKASAILDLDDAAVEQMREELFAREWARYESGELTFRVVN